MIDLSTIALFLPATLALLVVPGPAILYIMTRSINQGRRAGILSALGVGVGGLMHVVAATVGLSTLLVASASAFSVVKYVGAAYLIVLGIRTLRTRGQAYHGSVTISASLWRIFWQGAIVQIFNPKVALFFLAFLPQFVDPFRGAVALQTLFLGGLFVATGICTDSAYAMLASAAGRRMQSSPRFVRRQRLMTGSIYLGLGLTTAFAGVEKT